jgi:tRNA pseudouridine13 synthase
MGGDYSVDVVLYSRDEEQFVRTDLENLTLNTRDGGDVDVEKREGKCEGGKLAIVLKFQLGSSQYATMALRELMRGKVKAYKPDFGGGR